jgi:hypothetical protein
MKITTLAPVVAAREAVAGKPRTATKESGQDRVALSTTGAWVQDLRAGLSKIPNVRADAVAQAKADLASGEIDSDQNIDALLDALTIEL